MTKTSTQLMSVFALSAAALFLDGCKPSIDSDTVDPETKVEPSDATKPGGDATAPAGGDPNEVVKCFGINECAGQSACNVNKPELGIDHACAGENACRGKGWIKVPRSECDEKSGEVVA